MFQCFQGFVPIGKTLHAARYGAATVYGVDLIWEQGKGAYVAGPDTMAVAAVSAAEAGYADQAHLTRECVALSGLPPAALARLRGAS